MAVAACTTSPGSSTESFDSVHARFAAEPTRLFAAAQPSAGSIDARRWTHDGWQDGETTISVSNGELVAKLDASGQLAVSTFAVALDPIDVPESVFGKPAQLTDVRLVLGKPLAAAMTWTDDDHASATIMLDLDLGWTLTTPSGTSPLGTQHLPTIPLDLAMSGTGDHVEATFTLHGDGELWSWAGLLELQQLELTVSAATVD